MGENTQLIELYSEIKNPIENPGTIVRLLDDYSKSREGEFYDQVMSSKDKEYSNIENSENISYSDFYTTVSNIWKKSVKEMSYDKFYEFGKQGIYRIDFMTLRSDLNEKADFKSLSEIEKLCSIDKVNKSDEANGLARALNEYIWKSEFDPGTGMIRINSTAVHASKPEVQDGPHRLYINPEPIDLYTLLNGFIKECEERNLPYDFEYNPNGKTDMPVLIKATDDTIKDYIEILKVVNDRYPEMKSRMKKPPIIAGSIDGWIGYGYELENEYTRSRISFIESVIKEYTLDWVLKNQNQTFDTGKESIKLTDYISSLCTREYLAEMDNISPESEERLYEYISSKLPLFLDSVEKNKNNVEELEYKDEVLKASLINKVLRRSTYRFSKIDPDFTKGIKNKIYEKAMDIGIDPYKFCVYYDQKKLLNEFINDPQEAELEEIDDIDYSVDFPDDPNIINFDETKPTLSDGTQEAEIIDFDDLAKETSYETITDTSDIDVSKKIEEIKSKPELKQRVILYEEYVEPKPKEEKTIFEEVLEEMHEEQRKQDELSRIPSSTIVDDTELDKTEESQDSITIADLDVKLPNGKTITLSDYYNNYYKLNKPLNASITLAEGKSISAREFMQYIILPSIGTEALEKTNTKPKLI